MLLCRDVSGSLYQQSSGSSVLSMGVFCGGSFTLLCVCRFLLLYASGHGPLFHDLSFVLQGISADFYIFHVRAGDSLSGSFYFAALASLECSVLYAVRSHIGVLSDRCAGVCDDKKIFQEKQQPLQGCPCLF